MDEQNQLRELFCKEFKMLDWPFWVSEKLNDYSTFHGQKSKPDILFSPKYVNDKKNFGLILGLELKNGEKAGEIIKAVSEQCPSYTNVTYEAEYNGEILQIPLKHILLATKFAFKNGVERYVYNNNGELSDHNKPLFWISRFAWRHNVGLLLKRFGEWYALLDNKNILLK